MNKVDSTNSKQHGVLNAKTFRGIVFMSIAPVFYMTIVRSVEHWRDTN